MKIRTGFVSNSSSSSFIVAFTKIPKSIPEMEEILFPYTDIIEHPYDENTKFSTKRIAAIIFKDMQKCHPLSTKEMIETCKRGIVEEFGEALYEKHIRSKSYSEKNYETYRKEYNEQATEYVKKFAERNAGAQFFGFNYSDNKDNFEEMMEHGDIFKQLPHITVSEH